MAFDRIRRIAAICASMKLFEKIWQIAKENGNEMQ